MSEARQDVLHQSPVPVLLTCDVELSGTPNNLRRRWRLVVNLSP